MITSAGFYRCCSLGASAPVVVKKSVSHKRATPEDLSLRNAGLLSRGDLRAGSWQNGFFADFYFIFEPSDFFTDFLSGFFFSDFCGKKWPEKFSKKIPGKIAKSSKINTTKVPNTYLQRGRAKGSGMEFFFPWKIQVSESMLSGLCR